MLHLPLLFIIVYKSKKEKISINIAVVARAITIEMAIEKRNHEAMYKTNTQNEVKSNNLYNVQSQSLKCYNYMGSKSERYNIAIAIL